jgi:hypothetical protein
MTYLPGKQALGDDVLSAAKQIVADPYLPEVACQVMRLSQVVKGKKAADCARTPAAFKTSTKGIGLKYAVAPLRLYVYHRQHPYIVPALIGAAFLLTFAIGYKTGRRKK